MTTIRHSLGDVLANARRILANDASPAEVLHDSDVPAWYLTELERDHIARPNDDLLTLIYQAYELDATDIWLLCQAKHLQTALTQVALARKQATATFHRQTQLTWPDSARVAKEYAVVPPEDASATYRYADILRCLRTQIDRDPIIAASVYYRLSPMAYWQMEAAQLAVSDDVLQLLTYRLELDDLNPLLHTTDLFGALCQQLAICRRRAEQLRLGS